MTIFVNGELVPETLIAEETERLRPLPLWQSVPDPAERAAQLRQLAELGAIDRVLFRQQIQADQEPLDPEDVAREVQRVQGSAGCRTVMQANLRDTAEASLRRKRTIARLAGPFRQPSEAELRSFFDAHNGQFVRNAAEFHAAHIVKNVGGQCGESEALEALKEAQRELEAGVPFTDVAERFSDCKGKGGDLGFFSEGVMVEEFEQAIGSLEPGQRTGIFRSPFGFHIAELRAKRPRGPKTFEEVAPELERTLAAFIADQSLRFALAGLRAGSNIERSAQSAA